MIAGALAACAEAPVRPAAPDPGFVVPPLGAGGSAKLAGTGVLFRRVPPERGARWSVAVNATSAFDLSDGRITEHQSSEYVSEFTVEILDATPVAVTRAKLVFSRNAQRYQGAERPTPKVYVVETTAPYVRDGNGAEAPPEEAERVLDAFPDLGTRTQIDQVLPDRAMVIGEEWHDLASAVLRVLHPRAWTLNRGTAVLVRADAETATFAITLDATSHGDLRIDIKGEATVRLRDVRLVSITLDGSYENASTPKPSEPGVFSLSRVVRDL
jgi:hypothetical protein